MAGDYELDALSVPESLEELHELMERASQDHPGLATDLMLMETAVIELAGNVVEHGRPEGRVAYHFSLQVLPDRLLGLLSDAGDQVEPGAEAPADPFAESGRGLELARAATDELSYRRTDGRNTWTLVRLRRKG
jgi:serine/threonine-protein kinase RsbW